MPYDEESFKAGFALGRVLWKPPSRMKNVNTGLGWTAKKEWLRYDAGTYATANSNRPYISKVNDGWAICVYAEDCNDGEWNDDWCGCVFISTDRNAAAQTMGGYGSSTIGTLTYLGLTWYVAEAAQNATWGGATSMDTDLVSLDCGGTHFFNINGSSMDQTWFEYIMTAAGVRVTA